MDPLVTTTPSAPSTTPVADDRLPWFPLALLAAIGFVLVAMETMPAGLLPVIADGMGTSEGTVGLFVSAYAIGTVIATVPAIALTRGLRRKPLIMTAIAVLIIANTVTAFAPNVTIALVTRFVAGAMSGIIWGMFATYARRISPSRFAGVSLAIVSTGAPVGFALGTPLGSFIGTALDWRWSFIGLSLVGVVILALIAAFVPDAPGQTGTAKLSVVKVFRIRGIAIILAVIAAWMVAHNTIYTYISPYLRVTGTDLSAGLVLLVYGIAAILGVVVTGALLDRHPRPLLHLSVGLFVVSGIVLLVGHASPVAVLVAAVLWGVSFGGASTQLQAALTTAGGENADVASAFLPVAFNIAIFVAGIFGAALLTVFDGPALAVVMIVFGAIAAVLTLVGRRSAFPARL
ncbi:MULTISPECIES: MFS transporter [unclassified Curtobacterium]|uniref:MFS transporter n=1 Tax=unclassified Curtobacterium TaxID=257496 RepID=UPI0010494A1A|nr:MULTISPECIES: MFS transporter [unclassified Curtobacterium]TCL71736.1 putative MFS family arabinose efflux permease [Curtobacterium sp. PhB128]TCL90234.1 putative MFS family arabinose efflux permease [Curtobacterium sp. PhB138]